MREYIVDFTEATRFTQIHEILKKDLHFPAYYGENSYALWDCLTDFIGEQVHITLRGVNQLTGDAREVIDEVLGVFGDAAERMETFSYTVEEELPENNG